MGRPRVVSAGDMDRAISALLKAGMTLSQMEVIVEPGRVRLVPKDSVENGPASTDDPKPKEWPIG